MEKIGKPQIDGLRIKLSSPTLDPNGNRMLVHARLSFRRRQMADTPDDSAWQTIFVARFVLEDGERLSDRAEEWAAEIKTQTKRLIDEAKLVVGGI